MNRCPRPECPSGRGQFHARTPCRGRQRLFAGGPAVVAYRSDPYRLRTVQTRSGSAPISSAIRSGATAREYSQP